MASKFETFKKLHDGNLFILPNAWDAQSALIFEESNYKAVGTSSAAVAASLGYPDGEAMPFHEYLMVIKRITASVKLPVTIDIEMGYGKTAEEVYANIQTLIEAGVVGINIEDSRIANGTRSLKDAKEFAKMLDRMKTQLTNSHESLFINVRSDAFLLDVNDKQKEAAQRIKVYENSGADGIFLPLISNEHDIVSVTSSTKLPLNVMMIPGLPDLNKLDDLGVKRVSMGPFMANATYKKTKELAKEVIERNSMVPVL